MILSAQAGRMPWRFAFAAAALALTSCAAAPPAPVSTAQQSDNNLVTGKVLALRPASINAASRPGFNAVLTALNQPVPASPPTGQEVVIGLDNGNVGVFMMPPAPAGPALAAGDKVAIVEADQTSIARR